MNLNLKHTIPFLVVAVMTGCTSEDGILNQNPGEGGNDNIPIVNLAKTPDFNAYSGEHSLGTGINPLDADVNGNLWYQKWDRPTNVTAEEMAKVVEEFSKVREGAVNTVHIDWQNYWVQQVYTGEQTYKDGFGNNIGTGSSHMDLLLAYNDDLEVWWPEHMRGGYEHVNNFNSGSNNTVYRDDETGEYYVGTTLMTGMNADGIEKQFGYHNTTDSQNHFEYIILEIDGNYYIGFDFSAKAPAGQEANKNMNVARDWIFNDWIVKISPAYLKGTTPETPLPDTPVVPEQPEEKPDTPTVPDNPVEQTTDEVEINLSVNDKDYLESHLSIHVRAATDVEVFLPVPMEYYCSADDMNIVLSHKDNVLVYGGPYYTEYEIGGNLVTVNVEFRNEGIRIWTTGINQDVIDYCQKTYGDGVTFEIWNYFNDLLGKDRLIGYLNQSTVEFLDELPATYINAFNKVNAKPYEGDCTVKIVDSQSTYYNYTGKGTHLNGSELNDIYELKI